MDRGNGSNFPKILNQKYDIVVGPEANIIVLLVLYPSVARPLSLSRIKYINDTEHEHSLIIEA